MKKVVVFSGVNIVEGGPLTILRQFYDYAVGSLYKDFDVYFLVNNDAILKKNEKVNIITFVNSRRTYFHKLYYEYFRFEEISRELKPYLWFSLNDCSPTVIADHRCSYWHNPSLFYRISLLDVKLLSQVFLQKFYYGFFYRHNAKRNNYIIVQQKWLVDEFSKRFGIDKGRFIISRPVSDLMLINKNAATKQKKIFLFPTLSRIFKNIELIGEAVKLLQNDSEYFEVYVTISGSENKYSKWLNKKYGGLGGMHFIGRQDREKLSELYGLADCLIFPSKLETWGLPISEFKATGKPMLLADLPYAHETLGEYGKVCFFNPFSAEDLASKMKSVIFSENIFTEHKEIMHDFQVAKGMAELFTIILSIPNGN